MLSDLKEQLSAAVETHQDEYTALLADLVGFSSTLGNGKPAQERLLEHVVSMGLDGELWDLDPTSLQANPRFVPVDRAYRNRPNLTATMPPEGQSGRSLVLNGHIDVVSPETIGWWQHDPWGGRSRKGDCTAVALWT